jgi:hypothetical protein
MFLQKSDNETLVKLGKFKLIGLAKKGNFVVGPTDLTTLN